MSDITVKNIYKKYGGNTVFEDFSMTVKSNKTTCIMGKSGRGKTVLTRLILGLEKPDKGEISGIPEKISAVFQGNRLSEDFTVLANVKIASDKTVEEIRKSLEKLELSAEIKKPVKKLSGGQKRRVAILRALLSDFDLLILDEPFSGLDDKTKKITAELIKEKTVEKTVIIITHDRSDADLFNSEIFEIA